MIRDAALVFGKDLRIEVRSRVVLTQVTPFVLAVVMLFGFALDADSRVLQRSASGLFWVTVIFAAVLCTQRAAAVDRQDGVIDALRLSGLRPASMFIGKAASLLVQLLVIEAVLAASMVVVYDLSVGGVLLLVGALVPATVAIAAAGALYGPLAQGMSSRDTVLPLLMLPALAPVLLGAARSFEVALGRGIGAGWPWVAMLTLVAVIYVTFGMMVWGPLMEAT